MIVRVKERNILMGIGYILSGSSRWSVTGTAASNCRICERQCAYSAHIFDDKTGPHGL